MINRVVLVGRITRELEIRRSTSGVAVLPFTLAIDSVRKDAQGNRMTNFIPCRALGNIAETIDIGAKLFWPLPFQIPSATPPYPEDGRPDQNIPSS